MARQIRVTRRRRQWAESREAVVKGDPLTYPAAAEERYRQSLESLIEPMKKAYERELGKLLRRLAAEDSALAMDDNLGADARKLLNSLSRIWQARFSSAARKITARMLRQVDKQSKANLGKSLKKLSGGLGIKTPTMPEGMREVVSASIAENVDLIKSISTQYHQRISSAVLSAIQTGGLGQKQIFDQIRHIGGMTDRRAKLIARDQVSKVTAQYNAERAKSVGVKKFQWVHSGGGVDQRKRHLELNGQIFEYDNPPIIDERTGERGLPGQLINCHTGDSIIEHRDLCNKVYRSWYAGELFTIVTGDDVVLRATPNHPILTDRGWIPVKLLNKGDNLICGEHERVNVMKANVDNVKSRFDDFFDSAARYIGVERTPVSGAGLELHGDITDSYIDVVNLDGLLFDWIKPDAAEKLVKLILPDTDMVSAKAGLFSGDSSLYSFVVAVTGASEGVVSGLSAILSILNSRPGSANDICQTLVSNLYAMLDKDSPDNVSAYIEFSRNLKLAESRGVELNDFVFGQIVHLVRRATSNNERNVIGAEMLGEVVRIDTERISNRLEGSSSVKKGSSVIKKINSEFFSGHVYNLETNSNWYVCNDIISHNCRCIAIPVLDFSGE